MKINDCFFNIPANFSIPYSSSIECWLLYGMSPVRTFPRGGGGCFVVVKIGSFSEINVVANIGMK